MKSAAGGVRIDLGRAQDVRITVAQVPYLSILSMLVSGVTGKHRGLPGPMRRNLFEAVPDEGRHALRPLGDPAHSVTPDCLVPAALLEEASLADSIDRIRATPGDQLQQQLSQDFGGRIPTAWEEAVRRPGPWLGSVASAVTTAGRALEPLLRRSRSLMHQEQERVAATISRVGPVELLSNLTPRLDVQGRFLHYYDVQPAELELAGRTIVLIPMISGPNMLISNLEGRDSIWIGYPVPGCSRLWSEPARPAPADLLALMLGSGRASILRALATPTAMSDLAVMLHYAPSTLTFHVAHLERLDLIRRTRRGRQVLVALSDRGLSLVDLMS